MATYDQISLCLELVIRLENVERKKQFEQIETF